MPPKRGLTITLVPLPPDGVCRFRQTTWQACTHFGGVCSGTDIDVRVLKGKKGRNVFTNFGARLDAVPPPHRTVSCRTVPYRAVPYCTVQYRTVPYHTAPTLPYPTLLYLTAAWYRTVPDLTVPYLKRTVPYHIVSCSAGPGRPVPYRTVLYGTNHGVCLGGRSYCRLLHSSRREVTAQ